MKGGKQVRITDGCRSGLIPILFLLVLGAGGVSAQTVEGPVAGAEPSEGERGMLNPSSMDLDAYGYVEEEFLISGQATRYAMPDTLTDAEVGSEGHSYRTRFIVRRPPAEAFNGRLVVEWNNVTAGRDLDIDWWQSGDYFMRNGYAFIAASPQRVGVNHMRDWNPDRYGELDVTAGGEIMDDALSYDIFTAIARAALQPAGGEPDVLDGLRPEVLLATGHSQSAARLAAYINHVHGLDPVFDGFMVHGGGNRMRDDQPVKIFRIMAETDMASRAANPQPDSETYRHWEVAGTSHVDIPFEQEYAAMLARESGERVGAFAPREQDCERPPYSTIPFRHVMNAAFDHLGRWISDDIAPPRAPKFRLLASTPEVLFERDAHGNILGGIRLAEHAVPAATNTGMNSGGGFCRLYGSHEPLAESVLEALYPDRDSYLRFVRQAVEQNLRDGYLLEADAMQTLRAARDSGIGRRD